MLSFVLYVQAHRAVLTRVRQRLNIIPKLKVTPSTIVTAKLRVAPMYVCLVPKDRDMTHDGFSCFCSIFCRGASGRSSDQLEEENVSAIVPRTPTTTSQSQDLKLDDSRDSAHT